MIFEMFSTAAIWLLFIGFGGLINHHLFTNKIAQNFQTVNAVPFTLSKG